MMSGDVFQERGYGALPIGFGEKPGLVVVDFQTGFTDPSFPMGGAPMVERGMVEWVTGHVLRAHLNIDFFLSHQDGIWRQAGHVPPLAQDRSVVVLGLGALGGA